MTSTGPRSSRSSARLRVTYLVDAQETGGAETYVRLLVETLADRIEPTVLAVEPVPPELDRLLGPVAPVRRVPGVTHKLDVTGLVRLRAAVADTRPHVVHGNLNAAVNNRHAVAAGVGLGLPVVVTLHSTASLPTPLQARLLRPLYRAVAAGIGVSVGTAHLLVARLGIRPERVRRIWNGVPVSEPRRRLPAEPVRIGAMGRLVAQKGFDVLVRAVQRLDHPGDVHVLIAGDGPEREALSRLATRRPVELTGFRHDVAGFLADLDVFCLPSRWEGLPFVLLEAMMLGVPVVATDVGDVREAAGPGAVVVPPDDVAALAGALQSLLDDPARRVTLGRRAHERASSALTVGAMADATGAVYEEVLQAGGRRT